MGLFTNFLGTRNGRFFRYVPKHVDLKKAPGQSTLPLATLGDWFRAAPYVLWCTPNGTWALIALAIYFLAPYDLSPTGTGAAAPLSVAFFKERFPLWFAVTFGYTAFWHVTLYGLGWAERPFIKNRVYNAAKVAHNLAYSLAGIAMWTAFENVFVFLWSTGRLAYVSDAAAAASPLLGIAHFLGSLMGIALWRDFHFYFAHRLIHIGPLYAQVHSLHHRNTDIEPFAGLCMHPIEHLYYYACILPSLVLVTTPLAFLWNGVHLLLAPGASHSGWEDHFQADAWHYFHHRYFSVNFAGANSSFLDVMFGTQCLTLKDGDKDGAKPRPDAKSTLAGAPSGEHIVYMALSMGCLAAWAYAAVGYAAGTLAVTHSTAVQLALLASVGPTAAAYLVTAFTRTAGGAPSDGWLASAVQLGIGAAFCIYPVYQMALLSLTPAAGKA